ncbi:MAG: glycoside hydrolase family 9 protein, partial [Cyanobacteria bacterium J06649_11]
HRGAYSDSISNAQSFYNSWSGYQDELAWGAIWLHKATQAKGEKDSQYLDKAQQFYKGLNPAWTHNWDDKSYGTAILLAQVTGDSKYKQDVETWLDNWANPNGGIQKTAGGLAWLDKWGSLRYTANTAFLASVYGDTVNNKQGKYTGFSENQINYILGDNPNNFSYMVGFGENYPQNPHHRAASGTTNIGDSDSNEYTLYGALVGGPSAANDNAYQDKRTDYIANEVALDYNAAFTGALARMTEQFGGEALTKIPGINLDGSINLNDSGGNNNQIDAITGSVSNSDTDNNPVDPITNGGNPNTANEAIDNVVFSVLNQWNNGFTANVKITNNSNEVVNNWEVELNTPFNINVPDFSNLKR